MSKVIDQRVVEMRFDNQHFEKNTKETMSTLDKLKAKLNLSGASKGLEDLSKSANRVNMNGLSGALDTVNTKFTAMQVVATTALANITNSAVNTGKQIINSLTVAPVKDGFQEYELMMNAIQTTMAGTGKTAEEVEKQLKSLDEYADKTIYSTADMMNNLPKFTNAGVELEVATKAMIGIANATAHAGGDANKASIAFYNLGQAIGTGYLTRMDYNSINNAGIATMEWKKQMVEAAIAAGTLKKAGDNLYKAGNKTLTLNQLFIDGLQEQWATADVMIKVFGDYGDETTEIGKKAYASAQNIKTYTMMMESLKATAGTGWKDTWQIVFGGLDDATKMWTRLTNFISGIITGMAKARNSFLDAALSFNPFTLLLEKLENSGITKVAKKITNISKSLEYYQNMVNKVWNGDYLNAPVRYQILASEGHDYRVIQNLVNLGYKHKITVEEVAAAEKKYGISVATTEESVEELNKSMEELTDQKLRDMGLTEEEIVLYRQLEKQSKKTGKSIEELLKEMEMKSGRNLLIEGFANLGKAAVKVFKAIGEAWKDAFSISPIQLYYAIDAFHNFTKKLIMSEETSKKLVRTLKGVFAILDIITMILGGGLKIAFTVIKTVLGMFNMDILSFTAIVGDAIVAVRNWIEEHSILTAGVKLAVEAIVMAIKLVANFVKELWNMPATQKVVDPIVESFKKLEKIKLTDVTSGIVKLGKAIKNFFVKINDRFNGVPGDIIMGLANGLKNGAKKVWEAIINLGTFLIDKFKDILGIHSPSTVFFAIGGFIIAGLIGGLLNGIPGINTSLEEITGNITGFFEKIDWSKLFAAGMSGGLLLIAKNLSDVVKNISAPLAGLGDLMSGAGNVLDESAKGVGKILKSTAKVVKSTSKVVKGFGSILSGIGFRAKTEGIKNLGVTLLMLVGAIYVLTKLDVKEMWNAVFVIGALAAILAGLSWALNKVSQSAVTIEKNGKGFKFNSVKTSIVGIGLALLAMGLVVKMMGNMNPDQMKQGFLGLAGVVLALGGVLAAYGLLIKGKAAQNMDKAGKMFKKLASTLILMVIAVKLMTFLDAEEMIKGGIFMAAFTLFIWGLTAATSKAGKNVDKVGKLISKVSKAVLLMVIAVKLISLLDYGEMLKGAVFLAGFIAFVAGLVAVTKIGKDSQIAKVGGMILSISVAMLLMVGVVKLLGMMDIGTLVKGGLGIVAFGAIIAGLIYMVKLVGPDAPKLAVTILAMSAAIAIMAGVSIVLGLIKLPALAKGVAAIALLGLVVAGIVAMTKNSKDAKGTMIGIAIVIGVIAASIAALSFIKWQKLLPATIAIGALMGMFALIANQSKHVTGSWQTVAAMAGVIVLLSGALYILAKLPIENTLSTAGALSMLLVAMSTSMVILSKFASAKGAVTGAIGLLALCVPLLALVGILYLMEGTNNAIVNATVLSQLLIVMTGVLAALTLVGMAAPAAMAGMTALGTFVVGLLGLVVIIGGLMEMMPFLQNFITTGINVLVQLAGGLGDMIGAFVNGIMTSIADSLPHIGLMLSQFMINATPFIMGAKLVDGQVLAGVGILTGAILALTAANVIENIASFLQFGSSFSEMGTELSKFMLNATPFITGATVIKPEMVESIKLLSEAILLLTAADLLQGLKLFGDSPLEKFASQMPLLGKGLKSFINSIGSVSEEDIKNAKYAAEAVKALAQASKAIPNTGGLLAQIVGDNDLGKWAGQLPNVGKGIAGFVKEITSSGIAGDAVETAKTAASVITTLAKAAKDIPNTGGYLADLIGDNDLGTFASQLPNVGSGIVGFIKKMVDGGVTEESAKIANTAAEIIKTLAKAAKTIPNSGGFLADLIGDNDLAKFAKEMPNVGAGIVKFSNKLGVFNTDKLNTVKAGTAALTAIASLGKIDMKETADNVKTFGEKFKGLGTNLADFANSLSTVEASELSGAVSKITTLVASIAQMASTNSKAITDFGNALADIGMNGVKSFTQAFGEDSMWVVRQAVAMLFNTCRIAAESQQQGIKDAFYDAALNATKNMATDAIIAEAKLAGQNVVIGFVNGISYNTWRATNAGTRLGKEALTAAQNALDEHSPSREAFKVGAFFSEGLAIGISDYGSKVYDASYNVADYAKKGLSKAVSMVSRLIDSDMDTQPVIRPVLDLSEVESGAGYLNSMFNNPSVGVMSNLNAISSGVNEKLQNGANGDIVSAINKLRGDLGNTGGDTYNINGITYDDGSNISTAVQTIVRAATIERRI